jgi:cell division control protein 7
MDEVRYYLYELLKGLKNLKDLGIYHRDIKPGNFLYNTQTRQGMIIDFGLAEIDLKYERDLSSRIEEMKK